MAALTGVYKRILDLAAPYLATRHNDVHTAMAVGLAYELLSALGGDEDVVIPAIILHDIGWKMVPEQLQMQAFGPRMTRPDLRKLHERESVKIGRQILRQVDYDPDKIDEILAIIDGHDTRDGAHGNNDMIVRDADALWRYGDGGFYIDQERFGETFQERYDRLESFMDVWFFTDTAKRLARAELEKRVIENQTASKSA